MSSAVGDGKSNGKRGMRLGGVGGWREGSVGVLLGGQGDFSSPSKLKGSDT